MSSASREYEALVDNLEYDMEYQERKIIVLGFVDDISNPRRQWKKDYPRFNYEPSKWKSKIILSAELEDAKFLMVVPKDVACLREQQIKA